MTSHTTTIDVTHDQTPLPNQSFSPWLRGQTTLFISQIVAVLVFISFIASFVYYVSHLGEKSEYLKPENVRLVVDYAHVVFMAVFILVLIQVLDDNERGSYRVQLVFRRVFKVFKKDEGNYEDRLKTSKEQLRKFKRRFLWFWIGMLCLYIFFACQHSYELVTSTPQDESGHSKNISVSVTDKSPDSKKETSISVTSAGTTEKAKPPNTASQPLNDLLEVYKQLAFPFVVFLFNNLTLLSIFWCFLVMYIPAGEGEKEKLKYQKKERKYQYGAGIIVGGLTVLYVVLVHIKGSGFSAADWKEYSSIFDALSGVLNAVALALLIARLDSKLISLPSWLISILYSYAAVQPLFLVFELSESEVLKKIATSVLIFVFVSKIYFFLIIMYALQTGKMLNYLFCFPILRKRALNTEPPNARKAHASEAVRERLSEWLRSRYPLWISLVLGLLSIGFFFIFLIASQVTLKSTNGGGGSQNKIVNVVLDCVQLLVVLVIMVILFLVRKENDCGIDKVSGTAKHIFEETLKRRYSTDEAKRQLQKFKDYFLCFWFATFFLYIALLLHHLGINFESAEQGPIKYLVKILLYPFLEFSLSTLNLLFAFWCFVVLRSPALDDRVGKRQKPDDRAVKRQKLLVNYSSFVVALLIAVFLLLFFMIGGQSLDKSEMKDYATVFDGVTGTLSAIALALLVARMDSKLFGLPWWSIWILFAYASIQPLFIVFPETAGVLTTVGTSVLAAALGLKICFFLVVAHSLQGGMALNYLVCFPFLKERVDSIFENQFQIRLARIGAEPERFTFSILKKNQLYYSSPKRLESREECDKVVHDLRERMEEDEAYSSPPREESGTYWVEVRSADDELLCESIPLRSEDEANELIDESIEKIPHCKYNRT